MRFVILNLVFSFGIVAQAQSLAPQFSNTQFSPSFGLMLTDFSIGGGAIAYKTTPEVGFTIGLNAYIPSDSDYLDYLTGLYYWSSKTRIESEYSVGSVDVYQNSLVEVNRLSLPVLVKLFPFGKESIFYSKLGIVNHFLLNVSEQTTIETSTGGNVATQNFFTDENNYNRYFVDGVAGVGIEAQWGHSFGFFVELNYLYGLTPITKEVGDVRASTFFTSFGIGF